MIPAAYPNPGAPFAALVVDVDAALHGPIRHGRHRSTALGCACPACEAWRSTPRPRPSTARATYLRKYKTHQRRQERLREERRKSA
jgi:hypothetical protein